MAVRLPEHLLTYEEYLAEGEVFKHYDIIDGVRVFTTNPTRRHQGILLNIAKLFRAYERANKRRKTIIAPCDVLIRRKPLRTRQPDVILISHEQWEKNGDPEEANPLVAAPELVVGILSPSDYRRTRADKIRDYRSVGVRECWIVSPQGETVEVLRLSADEIETIDIYGPGSAARSKVFEGLSVSVEAIFAP